MAKNLDVQYIRYYTVGSAARELAPRIQQPKPLPKPRKVKKLMIYIDPVAILGVMTAVVMMAVMVFGMVRLQQIRHDNKVMHGYVQQLIEDNARMEAQYKAGYDLRSVEETALALGMVPVEQVAHVDLSN